METMALTWLKLLQSITSPFTGVKFPVRKGLLLLMSLKLATDLGECGMLTRSVVSTLELELKLPSSWISGTLSPQKVVELWDVGTTSTTSSERFVYLEPTSSQTTRMTLTTLHPKPSSTPSTPLSSPTNIKLEVGWETIGMSYRLLLAQGRSMLLSPSFMPSQCSHKL